MPNVIGLALCLAILSGAGCQAPRPGERLPRTGHEISACGQLFHAGTRVVLWNDPGGFDAYRAHRHLDPEHAGPSQKPEQVARFGSFRRGLPAAIAERVSQQGWSLADLREVVHQVVLHYDACGTSARCFEVLHDIRGLSCHFLLDVDGTIYQTLDLKERAWHAGSANDASIGIEIAHVGAYPDRAALAATADPRVARAKLIEGTIHDQHLYQYDYTEPQYRALAQLLTTLTRIFPRIAPAYPKDDRGRVIAHVIPDATTFEGIIGHYHLTEEKVDPGPAMNWQRLTVP